MNIRDFYGAKAIAATHAEVASNKIPYLGEGIFPSTKKMGIDLKWIKTNKGLPVSLAPSAFDTVSTIRSREGFEIQETEMAFFKESMIVKEQDEQDIMRLTGLNDPYAEEVVSRVFDDAETLIAGAEVVPERMRMSLLAAPNGSPSISFVANGATYAYNYDPDGSYAANNFIQLQGTSKWDDVVNSDPMADILAGCDAIEALTGNRPTKMIINSTTMGWLKKNQKIRNYILAQNTTATVIVTDARVKEIISTELGVAIVVYNKQYKDEAGTVHKFYPDGMVTLIPDGPLGKTYYGVTPEQRKLMGNANADVAIVNTGVAVTVTISDDPVQTKTLVSEVVLPSFERMGETYQIKAY